VGLFSARVIAEAMRAPWPPLALAALIAASCAVVLEFARWLDHRGVQPRRVIPALVLLVYVFWPQRDWNVALAAASTAFLAWCITRWGSTAHCVSHFALMDGLTFFISLAVYLATLQKDVLPADNGEFQLTVTMLGILHQPGFPLYTLVGKLFTLLPFGTPALRLNMLSAFLAAGTLTLVSAAVRRLIGGYGGLLGGLVAALVLGTSTTFWAQATVANIRMPMAFFTAWCLYELAVFRALHLKLTASRPSLVRFALAFSLGLSHYFPLAFMGLFFALFIVLVDPTLMRQPRRWWRPFLVFAAAQLVWLYLPIRAAIAPAPETIGLTNLGGFLWYVSGQGFAGDYLAFAGPAHLYSRLMLLPTLFQFQMNIALLAAALVGAILLIWRDWRAGLMLVGGFLIHTFIAITYRAPQTVEYEMPAYVALAVMLGYGVGQISSIQFPISCFRAAIGYLQSTIAAGVIVAGLANGLAHAPSYIALANDRSTREYVEPILRNAPPDAIILSDWHYATPMWYLQTIEGLRRDVYVRYVFPIGGQEWSQVWRNLIEENVGRRPVIVTHYWGVQYSTMPYTFEPFEQAWLVRSSPSFDVPPDLIPLSTEFDGKIRLVGYRLNHTRVSPGQSLEVTLAFRSIGWLDRDYSLTVQLVGADGGRRTQRDRGYPTRAFVPGQVHIDRFTLPLEPTLPPGRYTVMVGVYSMQPEGGFHDLTTAGGARLATVAALEIEPGKEALPTLHPLDVPLANGPTLTGVDYDLSVPSSRRVYLHWRGPGRAGLVAAMGDEKIVLPELPPGAAVVTAFDVPLTLPLRLTVRRSAGAWGWPISIVELPASHPSDRYVLFSDEMALIGLNTPRRQVKPGQPLDLTLRFLALRPLVSSDVISVRVEVVGASDDRPAANAFPTFKWIAGSVVDDRRQFVVPADAGPGRVSGHLTVYDEFREDVLPPLDARMGDSVPLGDWVIER